jgi:hypothetical protein
VVFVRAVHNSLYSQPTVRGLDRQSPYSELAVALTNRFLAVGLAARLTAVVRIYITVQESIL